MKKIFIPALASLLFLAASCNSNGYKVQGNIENAQDGDTVFFARLADEGWMPADTAIVSNGKFQIEGTADSSEIFSYFFENESSYYQDILFIEPGTITLFLKGSNEDVEIKGSKSNEIYRSTMDTLTAYRKEMNSIYEKAMSKEEGQRPSEEIMAEIKGLEDKAISFLKKQTSDNIDNLAGYFLFASNVSIFTPEEVQGIVEKMPANFKSKPIIQDIIKELEKNQATAVGKQFTDFTVPGIDGKEIKLSEIVKNNKLTLVDFWASWCGPCRAEMPMVTELYKKYHDKGLEILGVSFDEDETAWKNAVKEMNMTWPQGSELKSWNNEAAQIYGVQGIPYTLLINQEGTIIAKELRGENLENFIAVQLK